MSAGDGVSLRERFSASLPSGEGRAMRGKAGAPVRGGWFSAAAHWQGCEGESIFGGVWPEQSMLLI